jgi:transposase
MADARKAGKTGGEIPDEAEGRTGMFTSGIVSTKDGHRIALYFSGRRHAGENLADILRRRREGLETPIQMCDALSRNLPKELEVILANCIAHARRRYVALVENFPQECRHVIEELAKVYKNDEVAREKGMTPEERLAFHQANSGPVMDDLHAWLNRQFDEKRIEPNSGLGDAISYSLDHWEKLTQFLRTPGAPLDNNIAESALRKAVIHRNNSLFYKTEHGAEVGDGFMSLINTCRLNGEDPFHYLTELQLHHKELAANPKEWMPWNYRATLARIHAASAGQAVAVSPVRR